VAKAGLPLEGLRVLELGHIVAGPTASLILADLGADVIKVERPDGGDQARRMPGASAGFYLFNRNKRSLAIDLKLPAGKAVFLKLASSADICLDNYAPGRSTIGPELRRPGSSQSSPAVPGGEGLPAGPL
jgi:crotonobetainyl-CoA:carnitine CoA-transferase CaiB-like acyl-CoA transferase